MEVCPMGPQENPDTKLEPLSTAVSLSDVRIAANEPQIENHMPTEIC